MKKFIYKNKKTGLYRSKIKGTETFNINDAEKFSANIFLMNAMIVYDRLDFTKELRKQKLIKLYEKQ